jgi:hypothetical protein
MIYQNVPTMEDTKTEQDYLDSIQKIIDWGYMNLPQVNRAHSIAHKLGVPEERNNIACALLISAYVEAVHGWQKCAAMQVSSSFDFAPIPKPRSLWKRLYLTFLEWKDDL